MKTNILLKNGSTWALSLAGILMLLAAPTWADDTPAKAGNEAGQPAEVKQEPAKGTQQAEADDAAEAKAKAEEERARRQTARRARVRTTDTLEPDANAKWACEKDTVEREPAWRHQGQIEFPFEIKNEGSSPLKFKARGGCGTAFMLGDQKTRVGANQLITIPAGQTQTLTVGLSCPKLKDKFTRTINITTNDPEHAKAELHCKGQILEAVTVKPRMANFGMVSNTEAPKTRKVEILKGDAGPIHPRIKMADNKNFDVRLQEIKPGEAYELLIDVKPPLNEERVRGAIQIETGIEESPTTVVNVYATRAPFLVTNPRLVRVPPTIPPNWESPVRIQWQAKGDYKVTDAKSNDPRVSVKLEERDGDQYVVLSFPDDFQPTSRTGLINLTTNHPQQPTERIQILYSGALQGQPRTRAVPARPMPVAGQGQISPVTPVAGHSAE